MKKKKKQTGDIRFDEPVWFSLTEFAFVFVRFYCCSLLC